MTERTPKYGGYHARLVRREDAELTHVGPGTPGGEYLRRFWHPIALVEELGAVPLALSVLGEDLVLFRDLTGRIGLLHRRCSHRGACRKNGIFCRRNKLIPPTCTASSGFAGSPSVTRGR